MVEFLSTFDLRLWLIETIPNVVFFFTFGVALLISLDFLQEHTWRNYRTVKQHEIVRGLITYKISELWAFLKTKITRKHKISCFEPMSGNGDGAIEDFLIIIIGVVLIVDIVLLFMYSFLVYSFWITVFMMILIINVMISILIKRIRKKTIDKNEVYRIMKE